jgi:simple sugar transport system permease protein
MVIGRGMAMLFTGGYVLNFDHPTYLPLGVGNWLGLPIPIYIAIFILIILSILTTRTPLGLLIQSTGGNETASRYSGTNTTLVRILVYVIAGICAWVAGIIFTVDVQSADAAFIGMTVVIISGGIDLSVGAVISTTAMIIAVLDLSRRKVHDTQR